MHLAYSDGRLISEMSKLVTSKPIGNAPIEFSAEISKEGALILKAERAAYYRATDDEQRFTLTIDTVKELTIAGTIRRR